MAIYKEIKGNELYLYMNGKLIFKRWLDRGHSKVFDVIAYDKYTFMSIRDLQDENPMDLFPVNAKLTLLKTESGGRQTGIKNGYRASHVFENKEGKKFETYIGDVVFDKDTTIEPGETKEVTIRFLLHQYIEGYLDKGNKWMIHEGGICVGHCEVV
jgi:hypothetical protein